MSTPSCPCKSDEPVPSTSRTAKDEDRDIKNANLTKLFPSGDSSENNENVGQPCTSNSSPSNIGVKEIFKICGVDVVLPVTPNSCQKEIISQVITAIQQSKNCLVESPTGTGKTLALLCATLAWQQQEKMGARLKCMSVKETACPQSVEPGRGSRGASAGDWGAVVLVDHRYSKRDHTHLSTWVKERLGKNHYDHRTFFEGDNSLKAFMTRMNNEQ